MDAELKNKWVAALRSGKYKRAEGNLYKDGGYCCLGVLCSVMGARVKDGRLLLKGEDIRPSVLNETICPSLVDLSHQKQLDLANRNDGVAGREKHSFKMIAEYIEKNVEISRL